RLHGTQRSGVEEAGRKPVWGREGARPLGSPNTAKGSRAPRARLSRRDLAGGTKDRHANARKPIGVPWSRLAGGVEPGSEGTWQQVLINPSDGLYGVMVVIHRAFGFRFVIYTLDHEPAHV